jgi:hypothetical protein
MTLGRMAGLVAGAAYLEALFHGDSMREFLGMSTIALVATTAALLVVRAMGVRLTRRDDPGPPAPAEVEGLRFSIRGLMLFTAAVAVLAAGARALRGAYPHRPLGMAVLALCSATVGLAALWATLGNARPIRRAPVAFVLSPALGALFAFAVDAHPAGWVYVILTMLLYPALLLGSLLLVRSCGYRLRVGSRGSDPLVP